MASPAKSDSSQTLPKVNQHSKRQTRTRKSLAESPLPSQRPKKRRREKTPEILYPIRNIVDENDTCYLIDWEDDSATGAAFGKTWEPKKNATKRAIEDWEATKEAKLRRGVLESSSEAGPAIDSQDSEPVRVATRKRQAPELRTSSQGSLDQYLALPSKRPRKAGTVHSARFSYSREERPLQLSQDEIADSFEEDTPPHPNVLGRIQVVIPYDPDFNREAYIKALASSQSNSQTSNPNLETPLRLPSVLVHDSGPVIPDSQELFESSPSQQSKSATVSTGLNIPNTATSGQSNSEVFHVPVHEDPSRGRPASYPVITWSFSESFIEPQGYRNPASSSVDNAERRERREQALPLSQRLLSILHASTEDFQLQTQTPFLRESSLSEQDESAIPGEKGTEATARGHKTRSRSLIPTETSLKTSSRGQSKEDLLRQRGNQEKATLSSDEPWQGAQVVLPLDASASQGESGESIRQTIYSSTIEAACQASISEAETSERSFPDPVLSPRDQNSCTSLLDDQSQHQVTTNSCENIIASIERESYLQDSRSDPGVFTLLSSGAARFPDTYEGHYPPKPETPSDFDMGDEDPSAPGSSMGFKEKIQRRREEARAKLSADSSSRSPSEIPPRRPSPPPPTSMSQMLPAVPVLPIRDHSVDQLMASVEEQESSGINDSPPEELLSSLQLPMRKSADRVVSLPIISMVREVYETILRNNKQDIKTLILDHQLNSAGILRIDAMVRQLQLVTDHQDLIADATSTQAALSDEHQSKWAETSSSKFLFLREFLDALRPHEKHIAVLARPGRMLDILEAMLRANRYVYARPDVLTRSGEDASGSLKVTLLPTGLDGSRYVVTRADAVIAFDDSFRAGEQYSQILRTDMTEPQKLSLLLSLVVTNSAEHIELCLPKDISPSKRKRFLVGYIWQKRHEVGKLDNYPPPDQAAVSIAQYLTMDVMQDPPWPLPENPDIEGIRPSSDEPTDRQSGSTTQSRDDNQFQAPLLPSSIKRALDGVDTESTKRMRMTPSSGDITQSGDVTQVSEGVDHISQVRFPIDQEVKETIEQARQLDDTQSDQILSLLEKVAELQSELQQKAATEEKLRNKVNDLDGRLEDYAKSIRRIQPKYRASIKERGEFEMECKNAQARAATLSQRLESRVTDITKLKGEKALLESNLAAARVALSNSDVPQVAELARTQDQVRGLEAEKTHLEKRISSMQKDFDFTRDAYQQASTSAVELAQELSELKVEMITLERKASENTLRIAEIQRSNEGREREERIAELEVLLKDRETELQRKNEELKAKTNGRRETRGTSVPRSPRLGTGAMSPRPYGRTAGGSRQNSPAPGDPTREGFRDAILFPASGASHRWQHLT